MAGLHAIGLCALVSIADLKGNAAVQVSDGMCMFQVTFLGCIGALRGISVSHLTSLA